MADSTAPVFRFFDLPRNLRNRAVGFLLDHHVIPIDDMRAMAIRCPQTHVRLVNRQTRKEYDECGPTGTLVTMCIFALRNLPYLALCRQTKFAIATFYLDVHWDFYTLYNFFREVTAYLTSLKTQLPRMEKLELVVRMQLEESPGRGIDRDLQMAYEQMSIILDTGVVDKLEIMPWEHEVMIAR
jgi:hypothetical protein